MKPTDLYRRFDGSQCLGGYRVNVDVRQQREDEAEAELASALLRDATIRAIMAQADRHGTDIDTAASFLLSKGKTPEALVVAE